MDLISEVCKTQDITLFEPIQLDWENTTTIWQQG